MQITNAPFALTSAQNPLSFRHQRKFNIVKRKVHENRKAIYGDILEGYMNEKRYRRLCLKLKKYLSCSPKETFLDIGCGTAAYFQYFELETKIGLDLDNYRLCKAKKDNPESHFCLGEAAHLPFRDQSFNVVLSSELIEHLRREEHNYFFHEVWRILKRDGILILSTVNREDLKGRMKRLSNSLVEFVTRSMSKTEFFKLRKKQFEEISTRIGTFAHHKYEYTPNELQYSLKGFITLEKASVTLAWFPLIILMEKIPSISDMIMAFVKVMDDLCSLFPGFYLITWQFILVAKKLWV